MLFSGAEDGSGGRPMGATARRVGHDISARHTSSSFAALVGVAVGTDVVGLADFPGRHA